MIESSILIYEDPNEDCSSPYGKLLASVVGGELIAYRRSDNYSGEWIAVLKRGEGVEIWKGTYGSCSGCDFLDNFREYGPSGSYYKVPVEEARDYFRGETPFLSMGIETARSISLASFKQVMPRNLSLYDFSVDDVYWALQRAVTPAEDMVPFVLDVLKDEDAL